MASMTIICLTSLYLFRPAEPAAHTIIIITITIIIVIIVTIVIIIVIVVIIIIYVIIMRSALAPRTTAHIYIIYIYIHTFGVFLGKPSVDPKLHQKWKLYIHSRCIFGLTFG